MSGQKRNFHLASTRTAHSPLDLGEFLLGLQLVNGNLAPGLQLVAFFAGRRVGFVDHAGAELHESLHIALRSLFTHSNGERQGAQLVDLILLRVSGLTAAVEDIIPLLAVWSVEYAA